MPPEAPSPAEDRAAAVAAADLLAQGWAVHLLSTALCAGAVAALLSAPGWRSVVGLAAILLVGLAET